METEIIILSCIENSCSRHQDPSAKLAGWTLGYHGILLNLSTCRGGGLNLNASIFVNKNINIGGLLPFPLSVTGV